MNRTSWRALAGILALSIGGFVVLANDKPKDQPAANTTCCQCPIPCTPQCPCPQPCPCPSECPCPASCSQPCCPPTECPCPATDADGTPVPCPSTPSGVSYPTVVFIPATPKQVSSPIKTV